jgi:hypothetical protein
MSQQCPDCRLFNPDTALRCDCGYDFVARSMKGSYLVADAVAKRGADAFVREASGSHLKAGVAWIVIGLVISLSGLIANGRVRIGWPLVVGAIFVIKGLTARDVRQLVKRVSEDPSTRSRSRTP